MARRMVVLGLWDGHDSGAALVVDGRLVSAVNEERLTRRKLEVAFPSRSIALCLSMAGIAPAAVDVVAVSTTDPAKTLARWVPALKEAYYQTRRRQTPPGRLAAIAATSPPRGSPARVSRCAIITNATRPARRPRAGSSRARW